MNNTDGSLGIAMVIPHILREILENHTDVNYHTFAKFFKKAGSFFPNFLTLPNCQVPANQTAKCTFLGGMPKKFMAWILIVWADIGSRAAPVPPDSTKTR